MNHCKGKSFSGELQPNVCLRETWFRPRAFEISIKPSSSSQYIFFVCHCLPGTTPKTTEHRTNNPSPLKKNYLPLPCTVGSSKTSSSPPQSSSNNFLLTRSLMCVPANLTWDISLITSFQQKSYKWLWRNTQTILISPTYFVCHCPQATRPNIPEHRTHNSSASKTTPSPLSCEIIKTICSPNQKPPNFYSQEVCNVFYNNLNVNEPL